jgi:hypothetical protein
MPRRKNNMTEVEMLEWLGAQYDINENGCWVWKNATNEFGYGFTTWDGHRPTVHRLYWLLSGRTIPEGLEICHGHGCSKACYNPAHLRTDTHSANLLDKHRDGTMTHAKVTREQVLEIRERAAENQRELAKEYGVNHSTISSIILRKKWRWL